MKIWHLFALLIALAAIPAHGQSNPYCPTGNAYLVPQSGGTPICVPPFLSNIGAPTGACINSSIYQQQDATPGSNLWLCIGGTWEQQGGGGGGGSAAWGAITGTLSSQTDLQNALNLKANLLSPNFTGVPTAPTAAPGTNTAQIATTAFVLANGGGSFTAGLDLSGSSVSQTVIGLRGISLPTPTPGVLTYDGSALSWNSPPNGVLVTSSPHSPVCGEVDRVDNASATTINLPAIAAGCMVAVIRGPSAGTVTIAPPGGVSYDGVTTQLAQGTNVTVWTDGTGYHSTIPHLPGMNVTFTPGLTGTQINSSAGGGGGYTNVSGSASETTVSALNTLCGSGTLYATTPLSIATGGTLSCPTQFSKSGLWTIASGQTVTFTYPVTETDAPAQHFAGSGSVVLAPQDARAEWFGWVGDGVFPSTGTDNTAAWAAAYAAMTTGKIVVPCAQSRFAAAGPAVTKSGVKIVGACSLKPNSNHALNVPMIFSSSATATIVDFHGANSSSLIEGNGLENVSINRAVAPTSGAIGVNIHFAGAFLMDHVYSDDSIDPFNTEYTPFHGTGGFRNSQAAWCYAGVAITSGTLHGWSLGPDGVSTILENDAASSNCSGPTIYGRYFNSTGTTADYTITGFQTFQLTTALGSAGGPMQDIFDLNSKDDTVVQCANMSGGSSIQNFELTYGGGAGWCFATGNPAVHFDHGNFLNLANLQIHQGSVELVSENFPIVKGLQIKAPSPGATYGIQETTVVGGTNQGNHVAGLTGTQIGFNCVGCVANANQGSFFDGTSGVVGMKYDATSTGNPWIQANTFSGNFTVPFTDLGSGNQIAATVVNVNGSAVSNPNFNGTTPSVAAATGINDVPQVSSSSVSHYTPVATGSTPGVIKPDGTTCTVASGVLTCTGSSGATSLPICTDASGSTTAYTCTTSPTFTPVAGSVIAFKPQTSNSGTGATLNVNSTSAVSIAKWQTTTTLAANDLRAGTYTILTYDGTTWEAQTIGNAPSGSSGALVLIEQHTASTSASLNFTTCITSTYDDYQIEVVGLIPATNNTDFAFEFSTNGGSSYDTTSGHYAWATGRFNTSANAASGSNSTTGIPFTALASVVSNAASFGGVSATLHIRNPLGGAGNTMLDGMTNYAFTGNGSLPMIVGGSYNQTTAVNAFQVIAGTGNIKSGTVRCYGIAK